LVDGENISKIF